MTKSQFEIPEQLRDMAEHNVEQTRAAYDQFLDMTKKAQDMVADSSDAMARSARDIQLKAMRFAQSNVDASFDFASALAKAKDLKEYMEIQQRYAQKQMQAYADQAKELGRLMAEAAQRSQPKP